MAHWDRFESCVFESALRRPRIPSVDAHTFLYHIPEEFATFSSANAARCSCYRPQFFCVCVCFFSILMLAVVAKFPVSCTKHFRMQYNKLRITFHLLNFFVWNSSNDKVTDGVSRLPFSHFLSLSLFIYMWSAKDTSAKPYSARARKS